MKITHPKNTEIKANPHKADVRLLLNSDEFQALHLHMTTGQNLKPHTVEKEAFFYIIEGEPEVEILDERQKVEAGSLVHCPAGSLHCIYNPSDQEARILVVKQK
jgi:mannose-6-phosphate isomerase-like protein (cupin superfamily)